jgi:hypothetical protein
MKRAKFLSLEKQREFFVAVKNKLKIGGRQLSKRLGLKSRGAIENYTSMRTCPPVEIIKKLEKISGINCSTYEEIDGKIYRKSREFIPMDPLKAETALKEKFGRDFEYLLNLIRSDLSLKKIVRKIREKNYRFDNCFMSRAMGAYRTNLLSKIVDQIKPNEEDIIINGFVRPGRKTLEICFNLKSLKRILEKKKIRVGLEISKNRKFVRIFPLDFGRSLFINQEAIKVLITEKSELKLRENISIVLNPELFGLNIYESIYDKDSRELAKLASKNGFKLDNYRSTPSNHKGDLSIFFKDKNIILEVTQASSHKEAYFKVGQCYTQKRLWPKATHILICKPIFLSKECIISLNELNVKIIYTNFEQGWEKSTIEKIKEIIT